MTLLTGASESIPAAYLTEERLAIRTATTATVKSQIGPMTIKAASIDDPYSPTTEPGSSRVLTRKAGTVTNVTMRAVRAGRVVSS